MKIVCSTATTVKIKSALNKSTINEKLTMVTVFCSVIVMFVSLVVPQKNSYVGEVKISQDD